MIRAGPALAALAALAAAESAVAIPPTISPPEEVRPFTFERWTGGCTDTFGCGAGISWGEGRLSVSFEAPWPLPPARPARISYRVNITCPLTGQVDLWAPFEAPLAEAGDVAAHLRTAIENGRFACPVPPLDEATVASITRLVRLFTLVGGVEVASYSATKPAPFDSIWNHRPVSPDIWIDEVADYPESARQSRQGGAVETELTIRSESGRVMMCTVLNSSGVAALDEATCRLLLRRARFVPGAGPVGISRYVIRTIWDISKVDVPYCTGLRCRVGPDGQPVKDHEFIFK